MDELLQALLSRQQQAPTPPDAPAMFQPQEPDLDFKYHPFFQQLKEHIPKPWQRGWGNRSSDEVERGRWIPKDAMLRPEDAGDYGLEEYDRVTQGYSMPPDVQKMIYDLYSQGLDRIGRDFKAGRDPYNKEQPVGGGKY